VEFHNDEIEELQRRIGKKPISPGWSPLELYGVPMDGKTDRQK